MRHQELAATGATFVCPAPGVRVNVRGASLYALVQLPAYQHVNEQQLAPRIGIITGFHIRSDPLAQNYAVDSALPYNHPTVPRP
jgi:hypothetical protein